MCDLRCSIGSITQTRSIQSCLEEILTFAEAFLFTFSPAPKVISISSTAAINEHLASSSSPVKIPSPKCRSAWPSDFREVTNGAPFHKTEKKKQYKRLQSISSNCKVFSEHAQL